MVGIRITAPIATEVLLPVMIVCMPDLLRAFNWTRAITVSAVHILLFQVTGIPIFFIAHNILGIQNGSVLSVIGFVALLIYTCAVSMIFFWNGSRGFRDGALLGLVIVLSAFIVDTLSTYAQLAHNDISYGFFRSWSDVLLLAVSASIFLGVFGSIVRIMYKKSD